MLVVVIGDGQAVFGELLAALLEKRGFDVSAAPTTPTLLVDAVRRVCPDLCLLDEETLGGGPGLIEAVTDCAPGHTKVVVLSSDPTKDRAASSLLSGADGFVAKKGRIEDLLGAIDRVVTGERVVETTERSRRSPSPSAEHALADHLTSRERQCLALLVDGASTSRIARELGVSSVTVRSHIRSVFAKLGVHSRLEAASFAVRHGLFGAGAPPSAPRAHAG